MKKLILFFAAVCYAAMIQAGLITDTKYIDENGEEQSQKANKVNSSEEKVILTEGWYYVSSITTISQGIICQGEVHLILTDNGKQTVQGNEEFAGIQVPSEESSLTIYGQRSQTGQLVANGGNNAAGIGGGNYGSGSNIIINGGEVTANGGIGAAGIGGGNYGSGSNITINGGTVTATSNYNAYGIGSGYQGETSSNIFVADGLKVLAGGSVITHTSSDDIAKDLAGKNNVTAFDIVPFIKAINQAVGGSTDATIVELADVAKASVLVQTTADNAKAVSDLAVAKINALKEILPLIGDDANARNTEFISNIISNIGSAISENDITTTKTQALITVPAYLTGRSSALGTMGTKQDGPTIEVKGNDASTIKLYNIKNVKFGKEE